MKGAIKPPSESRARPHIDRTSEFIRRVASLSGGEAPASGPAAGSTRAFEAPAAKTSPPATSRSSNKMPVVLTSLLLT